MKRGKVLVVGGGLGGLSAATLLARRGFDVELFEQGRAFGGRAGTTLRNGFALNLGAHALYRGGAAMRVLSELGVPVAGRVPRTRGYALHEGALHTLPVGPVSLLATGYFTLAEKLEAARLLARLQSFDPEPLDAVVVGDFVREAVGTPRLRGLLHALFRLASYTHAPDTASAGASLRALRTALTANVLYLDGGWIALVDALRARAEEAGVPLHTDARVERIETSSDEGAAHARAVHVHGGGRVPCDAVVIAAPPRACAALLPGDAAVVAAAAAARPVEAACLDVALRALTRPRTNVLLGFDTPVYASVHSAAAKLAPDGGAVVHVVRYLGEGERSTERELEDVLERLQPGYREHVVHARYLPKLTVMNARVDASRGGLAGRIVRPSTAGVHLVGDWIGPEGLLADAVFASARAAAYAVPSQTPARAAA